MSYRQACWTLLFVRLGLWLLLGRVLDPLPVSTTLFAYATVLALLVANEWKVERPRSESEKRR